VKAPPHEPSVAMPVRRDQRHLVGLLICILMPACVVEPEPVTAPFGYDSTFDYLSVLHASPPYAYESTDGYPEFSYQDPADEGLTALRTTYDLVGIAGEGDEVSRLLNVLRWAHQSLRHDGGRRVEPENALRILQDRTETGRGVNCVMMAIVLNEAYLALGIPSRVVHGNGRDWAFNGEWHTFNAVFSRSLDKWLFVDPTYQAYLTDDSGSLLSVAEAREHLRLGAPLHPNADADYNGQPVDEVAYLHYLSKNLYRFSASLRSAFGNYWVFYLPDGATRTYVHLDPSGDPQDGLGGSLTTNYFTSNPHYYWGRPEP
jgi:hypothetical protein